jgi:hypothetical protein
MVEPIRSSELFGNVSVGRGPAPRFTKEGHELCAYYVNQDAGYVECPHGEKVVDGAFYSEDLVKELKETIHFLINLHDLEQQKPLKIEALRKLTI